jgi:hypothetical protein
LRMSAEYRMNKETAFNSSTVKSHLLECRWLLPDTERRSPANASFSMESNLFREYRIPKGAPWETML